MKYSCWWTRVFWLSYPPTWPLANQPWNQYQCLGLDVSTTVAGTQQDSHLKIVVVQSVTGVKEGWSRCRWSAMWRQPTSIQMLSPLRRPLISGITSDGQRTTGWGFYSKKECAWHQVGDPSGILTSSFTPFGYPWPIPQWGITPCPNPAHVFMMYVLVVSPTHVSMMGGPLNVT